MTMPKTDGPAIEIRDLTTVEEFAEAVDVQRTVWAMVETELVPMRFFAVAHKVGGQTFGAYDGSRMIGFLLAIPGVKPGPRPYIHSHMLAVLEEYRNRGLGRIMKLKQRDEALSRGLSLIEWTFDPLELKNAYFNIARLGIIVRRYIPNNYGYSTSPLSGPLPTDRIVAELCISSPRVVSLLDEGKPEPPRPVEARIAVPEAIARLRQEDPGQAREIQQRVGEQFVEHFGRGLAVIGFERSEEAGTYLLGQWE
jgi:predicted GNAT superfamily acetyltransferase